MRERQAKINKGSPIQGLVKFKCKENRSVSKQLSDFQGMVNQESNMKWDNQDTLVIL